MSETIKSSYSFIIVLSLILCIVCLLVGFYLGIETLKAMSILYILTTFTGLMLLLSGQLPVGKDHLLAFAGSLLGMSIISTVTFFVFKTFRMMGVLQITTWPTQAQAQPVIIGIGFLALTLNVTPQLLTTVLLQLPTAVGEESFFRVFLINMLEPALGTNGVRIVVAIVFGFLHYLAYSFQVPLIATACLSGYWLAYMYQTTHSAPGVCLAHFVWNLLALIVGV